uniref:C2H2-type domain-containing protein n=1 Tax=Globodera rostochiensis TaxID=31243 RepID=A0A914HYH5_GLORO
MSLTAKCSLCSDEFSSIDDLEAHISADHFNCLPFECEKCKFAKFPTEFAIKRHYEEDHGLSEYFVRYRVSREIYEKKQKVRECLERCLCQSSPADVGNSHPGQIGGGVGKTTTISVEYPHHPSHHQQQYQQQSHHHLHESEFLATSKSRRNGPSPDLFQSPPHNQHRTSLPTTIASEMRHHQSELLGSDISGQEHDTVHEFDQMGTSSLMGNLLEHIKPDMDGNVLSHFDQLYAADIATQSVESGGTKGLDKITVQQQANEQHDLGSLLANHKTPQLPALGVGSTGVNVVNTGLIGKPLQHSANGSATPITSLVAHPTPGGGAAHRKPPELQCHVCKAMVVNRSTSLMYHVNVKHLKLAIFKCKQCGEEFLWNRPAANRHAKRHGGDESLIENNTERLFPILNRHRREYFNLTHGKAISNSPGLSTVQDQIVVGNDERKMELDGQTYAPKPETADGADELGEAKRRKTADVDESHDEQMEKEGDNHSTPNTILAQLVDIARGGGDSNANSSVSPSARQPTDAVGPIPSSSASQAQDEGGSKVQKSIKCGGCGDLVINQEWILLNHVNTKHLHLPLYKCFSCDKPFENYLRSYAVRHAKFYHAGDESLLLDQRELFWGKLREACSRMFRINNRSGAEH